MKLRNSLLATLLAGGALLAASPSFAQNNWHSHPAIHGARPAARGFAHPFHAVVVAHTNIAHFTPAQRTMWTHGAWRHTWWHGRYGWWWNVGGVAFWYNAPVYPYPTDVSDSYYEEQDYSDQDAGPGDGGQYWYYCQHPAGYYPYVRSCRGPWEPVAPTPPQNGGYDAQGPGYQGGPGDNQGPPPGYGGDQGPPPGYGGDQGPPQGYGGDQGPPPGYGGDQGPPPDQGPGPGDNQGPPPGYNQGPN